jgi:hypothetical protein
MHRRGDLSAHVLAGGRRRVAVCLFYKREWGDDGQKEKRENQSHCKEPMHVLESKLHSKKTPATDLKIEYPEVNCNMDTATIKDRRRITDLLAGS